MRSKKRTIEPWNSRFFVDSSLETSATSKSSKKATHISLKKVQRLIQSARYNFNDSPYNSISLPGRSASRSSERPSAETRRVSRPSSSRSTRPSSSKSHSRPSSSKRRVSSKRPSTSQSQSSTSSQRNQRLSKSPKTKRNSTSPNWRLESTKQKHFPPETSFSPLSKLNPVYIRNLRDFTENEFAFLTQKITDLWDELKISQEDRELFQHFFHSTKYIHILNDHYKKLLHFKDRTLEVLHLIESRENVLTSLKTICSSLNGHITPNQQKEIVKQFEELKFISLETIEAIERWNMECLTSQKPFYWRSTNYLIKMETDLAWLLELPICHNLPMFSKIVSHIKSQQFEEEFNRDVESDIAVRLESKNNSHRQSLARSSSHSISSPSNHVASHHQHNLYSNDLSSTYEYSHPEHPPARADESFESFPPHSIHTSSDFKPNLGYQMNNQQLGTRLYPSLKSQYNEIILEEYDRIKKNCEAHHENSDMNNVSISYLNEDMYNQASSDNNINLVRQDISTNIERALQDLNEEVTSIQRSNMQPDTEHSLPDDSHQEHIETSYSYEYELIGLSEE